MSIMDDWVSVIWPLNGELTNVQKTNAAIFESEFKDVRAKPLPSSQFKVPSIKDINSARVILGNPDQMSKD